PPVVPIPPVAPGEPCPICFGLGGPWGEDTPSSVVLTVEGVEKGTGWSPIDGEPWNGTLNLLQTHPLIPCDWQIPAPYAPRAILELFAGQTRVRVWNADGNQEFIGFINSPCIKVIPNLALLFFTNGTATITIPEVL
ncbi:unnamed protein product, partial [marine sediment metagenome]